MIWLKKDGPREMKQIMIQCSFLSETKLGVGETLDKKEGYIFVGDFMHGKQPPYFASPNKR